MEQTSLEQKTYTLAQRYQPMPKKEEKPIPLKTLKYGMLISGIGTAISGAALLYSMFPDAIDSIIEYFSQRPF